MGHPRPIYLLSGDSYHHRKTRDPLLRAMLSETGKVRPAVAYIGAATCLGVNSAVPLMPVGDLSLDD